MVEPQGTQGTTGRTQAGAMGQARSGETGRAYQAQSSSHDSGNRASEMWDSVYDQGERYYRQGSQAIGNLDGTTVTGLLVAGAVGLGLGWLMFGQRHYSDDVARRMSQSSDHDRRENDRRWRQQ